MLFGFVDTVSGTKIHPTAVIDPGAQIGAGCEIGPYCVIGPEVEIGDDCWLQHHVSLQRAARIGRGNRFYAFCSIGQQTQDLKYTGEPTWLEVGDDNTFREFVTVNRGTAPDSITRIGIAEIFSPIRHIAHDCVVGDDVIFSNNGTLAGHVEVGDYAVIGGLTAVHQFCRIGTPRVDRRLLEDRAGCAAFYDRGRQSREGAQLQQSRSGTARV